MCGTNKCKPVISSAPFFYIFLTGRSVFTQVQINVISLIAGVKFSSVNLLTQVSHDYFMLTK
jgi:hypothetical protein